MSKISAGTSRTKLVIAGVLVVAGAIAAGGSQVSVSNGETDQTVVVADGGHNWIGEQPSP